MKKIKRPFKRTDSLEILYFKFQILKNKFRSFTKEFQQKDFTLIGNRLEKKEFQILLNENFLMQMILKKEIEKRINTSISLKIS